MLTMKERNDIVENLRTLLIKKFDVSKAQVFIYGSFLTEDYTKDSDIDIGLYCEDLRLRNKIYQFVENYFKKLRIETDIIEMELSEQMYINISIMVYGEGLTDYCPEEFINYITKMIDKWGFDPVEKLLLKEREGEQP